MTEDGRRKGEGGGRSPRPQDLLDAEGGGIYIWVRRRRIKWFAGKTTMGRYDVIRHGRIKLNREYANGGSI